MNRKIMFSVIMPVYNPGVFLHTAIEGILNQSYRNLELICIDDGSTDGSGKVLFNYAMQDIRMKIYRNDTNLGAAFSRNRGIELAKGEYILFVDADDLFEEKLLEKAMEVIGYQTPDIICLNYDIFYGEKVEGLDSRYRYYFFGDILNSIIDDKDCLGAFIHDIQQAPYGRIYNKKFLLENKLWFQELKSSNDVYFSIMATLLSKETAHIKEYINLVHVRIHNSRFRISNNKSPYDNFLAYRYLKDEMQKRGIWNIYAKIVQEKFLSNILSEISICDNEHGELFYNFLKTDGFNEMMLLKESCKNRLSPEYQELISFFEQENYDAGKKYMIRDFYYLIKKNQEKLLKLFLWMEESKKKYAIWGAGKNGKIVLEFCSNHHLSCEGAIDNDKNKQGENIYGYYIHPPEKMLNNISYVIICNQYHFNEIYDQIAQINEKVIMISLDIYLRYKRNIYESSVNVDKTRVFR